MSAPAIAHLLRALEALDQASEALLAGAGEPTGDSAYWQTRDAAVGVVGVLSTLGHEVPERQGG